MTARVLRFSDFAPKHKDKPERPAEVVTLYPDRTGVGFRLDGGELVQFPIQTCQQEPD